MALRVRGARHDARDLFAGHCAALATSARPREPPPPPPPATNAATASTTARATAKVSTKETPSSPASSDQQQQQQEQHQPRAATTADNGQDVATTTETTTATTTIAKLPTNGFGSHSDRQQERQREVAKKHTEAEAEEPESRNSGAAEAEAKDDDKFVPVIHVTPAPMNSGPRLARTTVRVAPFHRASNEVHRLKIAHSDSDDSFAAHDRVAPTECSAGRGQKKTSIMISGDDCYSTMNLSHDASTPLYQSSVVVADHSASPFEGLRVSSTTNTVTINVSSPRRSAEEELIYQHNKRNTLLSRQGAIIPIHGSEVGGSGGLQRSASSTSSTSIGSSTSSGSGSLVSSSSSSATTKRGRTLIRLDYEKEKQPPASPEEPAPPSVESSPVVAPASKVVEQVKEEDEEEDLFSHEEELVKILRNPVEAVRRNLVPHVCGRHEPKATEGARTQKMASEPKTDEGPATTTTSTTATTTTTPGKSSFIAKLLEDPMLSQVAEGLETETVVQLIENSLKRLRESRRALDTSGTKDNDDMTRLIEVSLQRVREERMASVGPGPGAGPAPATAKEEDGHSNRGSISSANSFASAHNYEMFDFDSKSDSDCYQSCSSEIADDGVGPVGGVSEAATTRSKFYQMLVDATLAEIELSTGLDEDLDADGDEDEHHYESIRHGGDPIYEEITEVPPPLPLSAPPLLGDLELEKKAARSMFEGASKYDILSYLVDAKERGLVREPEPSPFEYPLHCSNPIIVEEEAVDTLADLGKRKLKHEHVRDTSSSRASVMSDSSEDNQSTMSSLSPPPANSFLGGGLLGRKAASSAEVERNDSGVGSETSKSSRSRYQPHGAPPSAARLHKLSPVHLCEDCDGPVETQATDSGVLFAPLVCRKCGKKRAERKEIITEIVETEEKYGRDLQIILEEFCQPMLVAGLLTQEQLSAIFLNTEDLLENNQTLAERMRDALDIALEQGDDDLLTVNIGRIFLDFTQMLHAFESYCVRQAGASLLLANLEKEKELLRIFLKVSQMENTVLRRMNLNSFLMVPVQRVTKYPLLLARLYKVTPAHLEGRDLLRQAQEKIELHLNHINQEAKDVPTKLWRRISSSSPNRRASCEVDMINIKLRKMAIDVLEWNHDEVRFAMEGKLLYTQPTDSNWKKARTIKLTPVNALLVTNGKPSGNYKAEKVMSDKLNFPKHTGVREASLLVVKEKCGRYSLLREPLYLDRCVVCSEADWDDYFEVQEISSKDTFIFKAEDGVRTKQWYTQLQYHAQGMGAWRKRRNALANIMINGMLARS